MALNLRTETDIERLRSVAIVQDSELKRVFGELARTRRDLAEARGETFDEQLLLNVVGEPDKRIEAALAPRALKKRRKTRKRHGPRPQPNLKQKVLEVDLDDADKMCPACGGELALMSGQFETSEMVDVVEVKYQLVEVRQRKYGCSCGGCIETAPPAERSVKGGRYSLDVGVKVALDKYLHHIPLARQVRVMLGHGLQVGRNTLWDQLDKLADDLEPVAEAIIEEILKQTVIGLDQTGWPNLERGKKRKKWQMWCLTAPGLVAHLIRDDKSVQTFERVVRDFEGVVVCDALSTHIAAARAGPGIKLAFCWAHVRRKFADAEPDFSEARVALKLIRELYDVEAEAADNEQLAELRDSKSRDVIDRLQAWLMSTRMPKTTSLGNAIRYTSTQWTGLTRFLDDAAIPLDNNATERALRGPVVGRRNHFGSKSRRGTQVAAIFYTLLESAKLAGVDERGYLRAAIIAHRRGETLLPCEFARRR